MLITATLLLGCGPAEEYVPGGGSALASLQVKGPITINMGNRYQINKDNSFIKFKVGNTGQAAIEGSISAYQATMFYDANDIMSTSITLRIGSDGMTTSDSKSSSELQRENFLNTKLFPAIWFQGSEVSPTDDGFDVSGFLNIKDITRPISVHVKLPTVMTDAQSKLDVMTAQGSLTISRKEFGLGTKGEWAALPTFSDDIEIEFSLTGVSYTIGNLEAMFGTNAEEKNQAIGLVYNEVKKNGVESGLKLVESLSSEGKYKSNNWQTNLANIGWMLLVDDMGKESLPFFDRALKTNPEHLTSLLRLGDAYMVAGQYEDALAHYKKEWNLPKRARFTHLPHMIKVLGGAFELTNMR